MQIKVERPSEKSLKERGVFGWPIWTKEASRFDWSYDSTEECYFLEGDVTVETRDGQKVNFGKGDFVTFPAGLSCTWIVKKPVKKHYNFR
ncbi:MAG: cupin domain-containing protein [Candidatus Omnitrophica bacterium]|nr:cupin domain-containing protein [Candidatus Omnitrophota bacterium]